MHSKTPHPTSHTPDPQRVPHVIAQQPDGPAPAPAQDRRIDPVDARATNAGTKDACSCT